MITVHHLHHSRSRRIPWLLEELGLDYEIVDHGRIRGLAPPELASVHPLGKAPVVVADGRVLAESGAIIEYFVERHGRDQLGPPPDPEGALAWRYWMHYAEGSLMPLVVLGIIFGRMDRVRWPARAMVRAVLKPVRRGYLDPNVNKHLDWINGALATTGWFAGDRFSAADIQMSVPLLGLMSGDPDRARRWPHIQSHLERIGQREAYQRADARMRASAGKGRAGGA